MLHPVVNGDSLWNIAAKYQAYLGEPTTEQAMFLLERENPGLKGTDWWHWIYPGSTVNVNPSGLPSSGGPVTTSAAVPAPTPQGVVRAYFAAINAKNFAQAWNLGGKNFGGTFASFVSGFSDTLNVVVNVTGVQGGTVDVSFTATHTDHSVHTFSGEYTVNGGVIVSANVLPGSGPLPSGSVNFSTVVSSRDYTNPLAQVQGLQAERIDMGVDYGGSGPLLAVGNATVVNVYNPGWPGGVFLELRLTSGPLQGKYVYYAEYITPHVSAGQSVAKGEVIGTLNGGGMEIGWGDPSTIGNALATSYYSEGELTAAGEKFSEFLAALGAPAGLGLGRPVSGSLPPGYFGGPASLGTVTTASVPSGGASSNYAAGTPSQNLITIARFLMNHGYTKIAAAGIAACVYGESGGNPESVGSGGFGLIGWTGHTLGLPPGYTGPTGNVQNDLLAQMQGIVGYNSAIGQAAINGLNAQTSPLSAAYYYSANFEKPAITGSDVHPGTPGDPNAIYSQI